MIRALKSNDGNGNQNVTWNKHLRIGDSFVLIASSSHSLLLTELDANGLVEGPLR